MRKLSLILLITIAIISFTESCKEENVIKPPSKLRLDFDASNYITWTSVAGFTTDLPNVFIPSCQFNRNIEVKEGDVVEIMISELNFAKKKEVEKIIESGFPPRGIVVSMDEDYVVNFDLLDSEIDINGNKTSNFNLDFKRNEFKKISQFEPFDVVEDINLNFFNGNLKLHFVQIKDSIDLNYLLSMVQSNVESHKFKSDKIEKQDYQNTDFVFATKYRLYGEMATDFQFVIHDSLSQFLWGQVLIDYPRFEIQGFPIDKNTRIRIMDVLDKDIVQFISSFRWQDD